MQTFDFYLDTKVTTWYRTNFSVMAENEEKAKAEAIRFVKDDEHSELSWEHLDDTIEGMSVQSNEGNATEELFDEGSDMFWSNSTEQEAFR